MSWQMINLRRPLEFRYYSRDKNCSGNYSFGAKSAIVQPLNYNAPEQIRLAYGDQTDHMLVLYVTNSSEYAPECQYAYGGMGVAPAQPGSKSTVDRVRAQVSTNNITCILHIGDIRYARGIGALRNAFMIHTNPITSHVPYMVGIGNHEYDHITGGDKDPSGALGPEGFPSIMLIVGPHRPMYSSIVRNVGDPIKDMLQKSLEPMFYQYHVDINLFTHIHSYERSCPMYQGQCVDDGITHALIGMAGHNLDFDTYTGAKWSVYHDQQFDYTQISVNRTHLHYSYHRNVDDAVVDHFDLTK
ncbi:unnamed protein product [Rotaria magnacalcarata]|uniref:Purple acid phosphatase C-terminal domain-containing protein n=1 Tax=Rotaria magnacalcarata TaxID=392030 RepID=A0A816V6A5_9BILA|nr:unnamed protein product [Rotaria magnacalcarata]